MHGVIRFVDSELLPASTPEDYPKIIKSGIDEEGQHPKSPKITGPSGVVTLIHRLGRPQLLERLLDDTGTHDFYLRVHTKMDFVSDVYVTRHGYNVEIGFINGDGEFAQHGVRYRIEHDPEIPSTIGKWTPLSTSDLGSQWGGVDHWVRAQGAAVAKGIWFQNHWDFPDIEVTWSGMSDEDKADLTAWLSERAARLTDKDKEETKEYEERKAKDGDEHLKIEEDMGMRAYYEAQMACRADCGEKHPKLRCSKCKVARYCSPECQQEDWKYHKTYCGTESPVPETFQ